MTSFFRTHKKRIVSGLFAVTLLGTGVVAARQAFAKDDCCHPGAPCCHPGAECCKGHAAHR
jgi:hypothetical protein